LGVGHLCARRLKSLPGFENWYEGIKTVDAQEKEEPMIQGTTSPVSRRQFLHTIGSTALAAGVGARIIVPGQASAQPKTLRILQWRHFVPGYDIWFNETYIKEWGEKNDTKVMLENIGTADLEKRAIEEIEAQQGHDLFMFLWPPSVHEDQVIDHGEIYAECERKYGKAIDLAIKSTYNPKTKKFFGFSQSYVPGPIIYRKDLWDAVGTIPDTWEDIRRGGRKLKLLHEKPVGIGLASELDSHTALRAIMYAFGASVQNSDGTPVLKAKETLEALKFGKALYDEAMTEEVLTWNAASNNQFILSGQGSLALNAISIPRTAENTKNPLNEKIWVAKVPQGPVRRLAPANVTLVYVIWKFAKNIDGAKQFLIDYIGQFRHAFLMSEFYEFPSFPQTVPDLEQLLSHDAKGAPPDKYRVLADVSAWTTNMGYPGSTNSAIGEIINTGLISMMFAQAATGKLTPEEALNQADVQVQRIFQKWRERGKM
jgi:multiple sugar transport system substrate-binding protein